MRSTVVRRSQPVSKALSSRLTSLEKSDTKVSPRALPNETQVESGPSQTKSATSINLSNNGLYVTYRGEALATASRGSLRVKRPAQRRGTFETRIERYKCLCYSLVGWYKRLSYRLAYRSTLGSIVRKKKAHRSEALAAPVPRRNLRVGRSTLCSRA